MTVGALQQADERARVRQGAGSILVGALAARYSFGAALALLASIYLLDIVATLFLIPERRGAALD